MKANAQPTEPSTGNRLMYGQRSWEAGRIAEARANTDPARTVIQSIWCVGFGTASAGETTGKWQSASYPPPEKRSVFTWSR